MSRTRLSLLVSISCLLMTPTIYAGLSTSLDLSGNIQFATGSGGPQFSTPTAACTGAGAAAAFCSQIQSVTVNGIPVPITVSGMVDATYGNLSIMSSDSTALPDSFSLVENTLKIDSSAAFAETLLVEAPGFSSGFLRFGFEYMTNCSTADLSCAPATTVIDGQSYTLSPGEGGFMSINVPISFGVPFSLDALLQIHGEDGSEDNLGFTTDAELDLEPGVVDSSLNPIANATITQVPEISSWWLLLTVAALIIPGTRKRLGKIERKKPAELMA